jgi:uncharacterized cupin superfamily protein
MNDPKRIAVLRQSATIAALQDQGTGVHPKSEPPCRLSGIDVALAGAGDNACGIWQCTPGRFMRRLAEAEVMHILAGRGRCTPADGETIDLRPGDTLFFPAHTTSEWHVEETLRKVFVVMAAR